MTQTETKCTTAEIEYDETILLLKFAGREEKPQRSNGDAILKIVTPPPPPLLPPSRDLTFVHGVRGNLISESLCSDHSGDVYYNATRVTVERQSLKRSGESLREYLYIYVYIYIVLRKIRNFSSTTSFV